MTAANNLIEQSIPGFSGLTSSASSVINDLLGGRTSTGVSQSAASKFGVKSGMPGSGVSNAFGYDLQGKRAEAAKQRGIDDLLKLVTGYSGTVLPTAGQQMEDARSIRDAEERRRASTLAASSRQQEMNALSQQASKPKWGRVTSGWDANNSRPFGEPWATSRLI